MVLNQMMTMELDDERWQAVLARQHDAPFLYGVRSTGIYCRASCPSRRPGRTQVAFFNAAADAERAGFRPCRRCRPRHAHPDAQLEVVEQACRAMDSSDHVLTLSELGAEVGMSPFHLHRTFKTVMGITPRQYADAGRLDRFKSQLRDGAPVTRAAFEAGYGSTSRLYERTDLQLGMHPIAYRRGGRGMDIGFTVTASPLGRLLVAATAVGVCAVYLGDDDQALEALLRREYPEAHIARNDSDFAEWVTALVEYLSSRQPRVEMPLDLRATAFQWRVWQELQTIPYGATANYAEIARRIGSPTAARAVARACASNPVSVVIPCHRVVRGDGTLGGYRWGADRKRRLLHWEQQANDASMEDTSTIADH